MIVLPFSRRTREELPGCDAYLNDSTELADALAAYGWIVFG
jgi:hypothetical protein